MIQRKYGQPEVEAPLCREEEKESARIRESFAMVPVLIAQLEGPSLTFVIANEAYLRMVDRSRDEVIGKRFSEIFPELEEQGFGEIMRRVIETGEIFVARECERVVRRNGNLVSVYLDFFYLPTPDANGAVSGVLFQGVDVAERVRVRSTLEEQINRRTVELGQAQATLLALNQKLMGTREEEQRRLALELHDGVGQLLVALRWKLGQLKREIGSDCPGQAKVANDSLELLNELSRELRTISHLLYPPVLNKGGLTSALRLYVDGLAERCGLDVDLVVDPRLTMLPHEVEKAVFRIVQEALTNVHRHANSKVARVCLRQLRGRILLRIRDWGHGIPGFKSINKPSFKFGVGIQGMQERVRQLKGRLQLMSNAEGTTVRVVLPTAILPVGVHELRVSEGVQGALRTAS